MGAALELEVENLVQTEEWLDTVAGALQNIVIWSADRPMWQRDALCRLCSKESLDEGYYEELLV